MSSWTIESLERDYCRLDPSIEALLMVHRFKPPKCLLPTYESPDNYDVTDGNVMQLHIEEHNDQRRDYPIPTSSIGQTVRLFCEIFPRSASGGK